VDAGFYGNVSNKLMGRSGPYVGSTSKSRSRLLIESINWS
jgi:hypothetical protein